MLELEAHIEVIFNGALAAPRNDDNVLHSGVHRLFDSILDQRLIYKGKHLLRLGLSGGKKTRSQPSGGEHRLANLRDHRSDSSRFAFHCAENGGNHSAWWCALKPSPV